MRGVLSQFASRAAVLALIFQGIGLAAVSFEPARAFAAQATGAAGNDVVSSRLLANAKTLIRLGKYAEAESSLREYLHGNDDSAEAHELMGVVKFQQDRPSESLAEFTRAAQLSPPTASELIVVALDYVKLKDLANADKWMSVALEKAPDSVAGWRYMGGIKYSENRFDEAIAAYDKCLALHPRDVLAEDGLGRSYEGLSRDDDAAAAYRTALDWQSHASIQYAQPLLNYGSLLLRQGNAQAALGYLESAAALTPADAQVLAQLGETHLQLNQLSKAQAALEEAVKLTPNDSHLHWLLASVYRKEGLTEKAEQETRLFSSMVGAHSNDKDP
jgi:tetratricopeptide (TPR) repeat protein